MEEKQTDIETQLKQAQAQYEAVVNQNRELQTELQPFRHEYFKNLGTSVIAELAKKSIRLTAAHLEAEEVLDYIYKTIGNAGAENAIRIIKQTIEKYRGRHGKSQ